MSNIQYPSNFTVLFQIQNISSFLCLRIQNLHQAKHVTNPNRNYVCIPLNSYLSKWNITLH